MVLTTQLAESISQINLTPFNMATSIIKNDMKIRTTTISGTTNAQGALAVSSVIPRTVVLLDASTQNDSNAMCIPWLYNGSVWYIKVVKWSDMSVLANKNWTFTLRYIE